MQSALEMIIALGWKKKAWACYSQIRELQGLMSTVVQDDDQTTSSVGNIRKAGATIPHRA